MAQKTVWITGASSGIGREFAKAYAIMGYRLILTARRRERLEELAEYVQNLAGTSCRIETGDLDSEEECRRLCKAMRDEEIHVFINNAGFGTCGSFRDTNIDKEISMIHVNVQAMHILFKYVLRKMEKQGYGQILNVGSSAGLLPAGPYMATYYATKSYVVSLTRAVAQELKESRSGVQVFVLCPGPVDTEFNERADVIFALKGITPQLCVKEALEGMRKGKTVIVPTKMLRVGMAVQRFVPMPILLRLVAMQQKRKKQG